MRSDSKVSLLLIIGVCLKLEISLTSHHYGAELEDNEAGLLVDFSDGRFFNHLAWFDATPDRKPERGLARPGRVNAAQEKHPVIEVEKQHFCRVTSYFGHGESILSAPAHHRLAISGSARVRRHGGICTPVKVGQSQRRSRPFQMRSRGHFGDRFEAVKIGAEMARNDEKQRYFTVLSGLTITLE
jgi:hypothetical protein